jgi:tRNA-Thr(GGU) m(6)t(6)A37 methyltransferase TsaA
MSSPLPQLAQIGVIHSPYREKFAVPRQPGLADAVTTQLELLPPYNNVHCVRGLEDFSHIWVLFLFHQNPSQEWHPTVRPPRLGGNQRVGVFASRSPFRPNPIGLSVVELVRIHHDQQRIWLELAGADLVDGTPIVDIKPYIPFVDSKPLALGGFAPDTPDIIPVMFARDVEAALSKLELLHPHFRRFIQQVIGQDPRPAYRKGQADDAHYGVHLFDYNVQWQMQNGMAIVCAIEALPTITQP